MKSENIALFDNYLAGEMPVTERQLFEQRLQDSKPFSAEFYLFKTFVYAMKELPAFARSHDLADELRREQQADFQLQFENYSSGKISPEERLSFESRIKDDDYFAWQFERYREAHPGGRAQDTPLAKIVRLPAARRWVLAAAAAVLLAVLSWFILNPARQAATIYARYDVAALLPKTEYALVNEGYLHKGILGDTDFNDLKIKGLQAYDDKNWPESIRLLSEYLQKATPSDEETPDEINLINLYVGRAWLELGNAPKAIEILQKADKGVVDKMNYGLLQEFMRWQLTLAHLKNKDLESAKTTAALLLHAEYEPVRSQATKLFNELK
jgi:hypothetical protein